MPAGRLGPLLRYHWAAGTGPAGHARHLLASLPGTRHARALSASDGISLVYQGFADGLTYVLPYLEEQLAASGAVGTAALPAAPWPALRTGAGLPDADLVLTGCSPARARRLPSAASVVLPFRVNLTMPVAGDVLGARASITRDERRKFAKLRRRYGWTCEIGDRDADLDYFYDRMHLPTMAARHGEQTRSMAREVARHGLFRRGFVLFVRQGGERVAGVLCRVDDLGRAGGRALRMRLLGVTGGAAEHYRSGAARAVYHLAVDWAAEHGVTRLDFAGADPFPGRGVYQYKRRFHPVVGHARGRDAHRRVHLRVTRDTPAVRDLLAATPMLTTDAAERIVGTYFADRDRPARTDIRLDGSGVDSVRTVDLDDFLAGLRRGAPVSRPAPTRQVIAG
jgi:hypothetical protein